MRGSSGALVVAAGVEFAEQFAGGGVDDADVQVLDEQAYEGSGVGSPDADVVQSAVDAQGDGAAVVDLVAADAVGLSLVRLLVGVALGSVV